MAGHSSRVAAQDGGCADDRIRFLTGVDEAARVRPTIAASWQRSRALGVAADRVQVPYVRDPDADTPLTRSAEPVLQRLFDKLADTSVSIVLTDAAGLVLSRRTHCAAFERRLDAVLLAPGFSFAERFVGTNGIGTALESGSATQVLGHEHYAENLEMLACAAVPIHDRVAQRLAGVMNLTCRRSDADPLLLTLAETTAEQIEYALQADASLRELAVLQAYRQTCRRTSGQVLAVTADAVTLNDRARTELSPADQNAVLAHTTEIGAQLAAGRRRCVDVALPSGMQARLYVHQVEVESSTAGLIVQIRSRERFPAARDVHDFESLPGVVGESPLWRRAVREVAESVRAHEWVAVAGEPGAGKATLVRAALHRRTPLVVDPGADPEWRAVLSTALRGDGAVLLRRPDLLDAATLAEVVIALQAPSDAWVAVTVADDAAGLDELLALFARVVEVPPLRLRLDDLPALITVLLGRSSLTCSDAAMRMLRRASWPGNVEQLRSTLRAVAKRRSTGEIGVDELPPDLHTTSRRVLTPIEAIERDAIVRGLADANGDKRAAARTLGISRATIYRKIHEYGIVPS